MSKFRPTINNTKYDTVQLIDMLPDTKLDKILVASSVAIFIVSTVMGLSYFVVFDDPEPPLGTNQEEITNMKILQETHDSYLRARSYEVEYIYVQTNKTGDIKTTSKTDVNLKYQDDRALSHQSNSDDGILEINSNQYHLYEKGVKYMQDASDVEMKYDKLNQTAEPFTGMLDIDLIVGMSETEFAGYTEDREGLVYNVSASKEDNKRLNFDYDGVITVDEKGYVRSLNIEGTSEKIDTEYAMLMKNVGSTTVEEPEWLDKAKEETEDENSQDKVEEDTQKDQEAPTQTP